MTTFHLKLIAIMLMVLDHIGAYLLPEIVALRIVGRLSFPLFAWLIANGVRHTSNSRLYLLRLCIFALISQLPFVLVNNLTAAPFSTLNIFFTLSFGLGIILLLRRVQDWVVRGVVVLSSAIIAQLVPVEYGAAGVLSIIAFYYTFEHIRLMFWVQLAIFLAFFSLPLAIVVFEVNGLAPMLTVVGVFQPIAAAAVALIALYNGQKGRSMKYLFYLFYPVHLLLIYWVVEMMQ